MRSTVFFFQFDFSTYSYHKTPYFKLTMRFGTRHDQTIDILFLTSKITWPDLHIISASQKWLPKMVIILHLISYQKCSNAILFGATCTYIDWSTWILRQSPFPPLPSPSTSSRSKALFTTFKEQFLCFDNSYTHLYRPKTETEYLSTIG